jgi:glycosyltransferase involved in cell wall biosynthesis
MKISIITCTFNSSKFLRFNIDSVQGQTYKNVEQIFIDGNSKDATNDIIKSYKKPTDVHISEPDKNLYDAMNKGIKLASGDIIGILNSDDFFYDSSVLSDVALKFSESGTDSLYGNIEIISTKEPQRIIRYWKSSEFVLGSFAKGWHPPHPTFFVKRQVYAKYGLFDISFDVSADFELMLRFLEKYKISTCYLNKTLVKMRYGGESTRSLKKIIIGNRNILRAFKKNGIYVPFYYPLFRMASKILQFQIG